MSRLHSTVIALIVAAAAGAGLIAAVQTVRLGQTVAVTPVSAVPAHEIALRRAKLARWGRSLAKAAAKKPPALPKLPHYAPVVPPQAPVGAAPATVRYVQPPPVVRYTNAPAHTTTRTSKVGDDGSSGDSGGSDDGGGDGG